MSTTDDHHFARTDRALHWQQIATHLANHPADFRIALENIERWLLLGRVHPAPLHEWRRRILQAQRSPQSMQQLLAFLSANNHDTEQLKSCSPFVGLNDKATASTLLHL